MTLRPALGLHRELLRKLLASYLLEFDGRTEPYPYFDAYWEEPERLPLLIEIGDEPVGLCLIRQRDDGWDIAEFYVVPEQRRHGVGRRAVEALADRARHDGASYLEAKVRLDHPDALRFWLRVGFGEAGPVDRDVAVTRMSLT